MPSPFFGLRLDISCNIPARHGQPGPGPEANITDVFSYPGDPVVGSVLPEPIGGRFSIITKALLALAKCLFGPLAVLDVGRRSVPLNDVAGIVAQRLGLKQEPAILAIETSEPGLERASHARLPDCAPLLQHTFLVIRMKSARPASFGLIQ